MPKNETGEFELVLGNRQLLSGFAVVAILFGVFFAMGYIVGRNSTPSAKLLASDAPAAAGSTSGQRDAFRQQNPAAALPAAEPAPAAADSNAPATPPATPPEPQPTTQPARASEAPKPPAPAAEAPPAVQSADSLTPGTYLQVIATIKADAEVISKSLQDRKFPTLMTPSSIEGRFRVIVGPYKDVAGVGGAKAELENLGFHPIPLKISER